MIHPLAQRLIEGDVRALARVCRLVDDGVGDYRRILKDLFPHTGKAWTLGVTGIPGAGKSTLTDKLIGPFRADDLRVAVLAIDPTSPFSGGAILGDRIRMQQHHADAGVFIRSVATRGTVGGLSRSAVDLIRVLDAWQADVIIVETVGVGQDELEVTRTVDTTLVVMAPGMGDEIQAIKAGILECADTFAVNKADRDGADATMRQLELMMNLGRAVYSGGLHHGAPRTGVPPPAAAGDEWVAPIVRCIATRGEGIADLIEGLQAHRQWLYGSAAGQLRKLTRLRESMRTQLRNALIDCAVAEMGEHIERMTLAVSHREMDPYSAAEELVEHFQRLG